MASPTPLPDRMQADLLSARKARDEHAVTALRTTLAAFANAEAPPVPEGPALGVAGLVEHERLVLTDDDHQQILREQIAARVEAATEYDAIGQVDAGDALRAEVAVLQRYTA